MSERLPFELLSCASEDPPFNANELLRDSDDVSALRGWHSARNCSYPQEVILRFNGDVALSQLQILSHECKIATRVEVHAFQMGNKGDPNDPPSFRNVRFQKLGSIKFNSNEKSKFRSKERKTVHLKATCYFLKLVFHKNHANHLNVFNQVGVYSITTVGSHISYNTVHRDQSIPAPPSDDMAPALPPIRGAAPTDRAPVRGGGGVPHAPSPNGEGESIYAYQQQQQPQQFNKLPPISPSSHHDPAGHPQAMGGLPIPAPPLPPSGGSALPFRSRRILEFEEFFLRKSKELVLRKAQAVSVEDFDAAKHCKECLLQLQDMSEIIYDLETRKVEAIVEEEFKTAHTIKQEMDATVEEAMLIDADHGQQAQAGSGDERSPTQDERKAALRKKRRSKGPAEEDADDEWQQQQQALGPAAPVANFEEQPVSSKYAQMMAQQQRQVEEEQAAASPESNKSSPKNKRSKASPRHGDDEDEEEEEDEEADDEEADEEAEEQEEEQEEDEEDDAEDDEEEDEEDDASTGSPSPNKSKKNRASPKKQTAEDSDPNSVTATHAATGNQFHLENFPDWERDVYFAIHDEIGEEAGESPAEPITSSDRTELPEFNSVLGHYTTACLFSRRWRHRDAAIKVVTKFLGHHYRHVAATQVITIMLKYLDLKGFGLLDSIQQVFISSSELLIKVLEEGFEDCPLSAVQVQVANLLPRLILRAGDTTQKIRDDSTAILLLMAASSLGADKVAIGVLAEPVDHDKRRMNTNNPRIHVSRLMVLQQLLSQHELSYKGSLSIDSMMNKLLLPSLNHQSNEVREHALNIVGIIDPNHGQEIFKFVPSITNPSVRVAVEEKLGTPPENYKPTTSKDADGSDQKAVRKTKKRSDSKSGNK